MNDGLFFFPRQTKWNCAGGGEGEGLRKECKATVWVDRRDNGDGDSGRVLGFLLNI